MCGLTYEVIHPSIIRVTFGSPRRRGYTVLLRESRVEGNVWHVSESGDTLEFTWSGRVRIRFSKPEVVGEYTVLRNYLEGGDHVYGLGEKYSLSVDRRYRRYHVWNAPQPHHLPSGDPMYLSIPFYVVAKPGKAYGVLIDYPGYVYIDAGVSDLESVLVKVRSRDFDLYLIGGGDVSEVIKVYTDLTGKPYLPPKWAIGYHQSRYSYASEEEVLGVAKKFRELGIPCDALYLDIDYMDGCKVFTWDRRRFPDLRELASKLHNLGVRLVTIVDVGIKAEEGYWVYEKGLRSGAYVRNTQGGIFRGGVWPGLCVFPDFLNSRGRAFWSELISYLVGQGVDGIWLDMNEPEIFYLEDKLVELVKELHEWISRGDVERAGNRLFWDGLATVWTGGFKHRGYTEINMVHVEDGGEEVSHMEVHNLYPLLENVATWEGITKARPGRRWFILTRSGFTGIQRYSAVWTGDNVSDWGHLAASIPMVINLGLSGISFTGADVGGFSDDVDPELLVRWAQLGAFYPFFRNHSNKGTRRQEPWVFGEPYLTYVSNAIKLRYSLLPYIYYLFVEASREGLPVMRPLFMEFPDDELTYGLSDEFMLGGNLLVAPILTPGARARATYLPKVRWLDWWEGEVYGSGWHSIEAPLDRIPVFLREDHGVVYTEPKENSTRPWTPLNARVFLSRRAELTIYDDDGETLNYMEGKYYEVKLIIERRGVNALSIRTIPARLGYKPPFKEVNLSIYVDSEVRKILSGGRELSEFEVVGLRNGFYKVSVKVPLPIPASP